MNEDTEITVRQIRYWVPVAVQRDEAGEITGAFHPACGEYHPVVDGHSECPTWAAMEALLVDAYEQLTAPPALPDVADSADPQQPPG